MALSVKWQLFRSGKAEKERREAPWWRCWEFYLIALLAFGLRFYRIDTAQFMSDHQTFYQMAYDAVAHGLWPISGNYSSTGPLIPPLFIYIMMIPAAISPNPLLGNIFIALCNSLAVVLTYGLVASYYGRLAGAISALLYATAVNVIIFSRDIWQPDILPLLIICLLWLLLRGVIEGKRYWFLPSVLLIGIMYQFHTTALYLAAPLLLAILLAFKTIRWREIPLAIVGLLLLFLPYLYLEVRNGHQDLDLLFSLTRHASKVDSQAIEFYRLFVHSFVQNPFHQAYDTHLIPGNEHSVLLTTPLSIIAPVAYPLSLFMEWLLLLGAVMVLLWIVWPERSAAENSGLRGWWHGLLTSPQRKGLLLLLAWQGLVLLLLRHPVELYIHYLVFLLPGPFILIGLLLARTVQLVQRLPWKWLVRYGVCAGVGLIVVVQGIVSAGWLIDHAEGNFNSNYAYPQYFDLATLQNILSETDQLAAQRHLTRVYINVHGDDELALRYLAQFARTPVEVVDAGSCVVLPGAEAGPVVYVSDPQRADIDALINRYTTATFVKEIRHPGGVPFKMYLLSASKEPGASAQLNTGLKLLSGQADLLPTQDGKQLATTRWKVAQIQAPQPRTVYKHVFTFQDTASGSYETTCRQTRIWAGDQLFPLFHPGHTGKLTGQVKVMNTVPQHYDLGGLKLVTFVNVDTPAQILRADDGRSEVTIELPG